MCPRTVRKERLDGGPVDVFRPKGKRCAQGRSGDIFEGQRRGLRCLVEGLAEHPVALKRALGRPRPAGPARARCVSARRLAASASASASARRARSRSRCSASRRRFCSARASASASSRLRRSGRSCTVRRSSSSSSSWRALSRARGRVPKWPVALELGDLAAGLGDGFFVHAHLLDNSWTLESNVYTEIGVI